jgi:hypothetical protein
VLRHQGTKVPGKAVMAVKPPDQRPRLRGALGDDALKAVIVRAMKSYGVWHVTQDAAFFGDYLKPEHALHAAETLALEIERGGGRAKVLFEP